MSRPEDARGTKDPEDQEIRIGISSCLLGEKVRFDGGHKRNDYITRTLAPFVRFVPLCPEVEIGLGTPRQSLRLLGGRGGPRLVSSKGAEDRTREMSAFSCRAAARLGRLDLAGYILKKDSPSCGMERVRVYDKNGVPTRTGRGLFAAALMERLPHLPVEEEGRLNDPRLRENFLERVFAYQRLKDAFQGRWSMGDLVRFHTREKMLLLAHDPGAYRDLGRIVARGKGIPRRDLATRYQGGFLGALSTLATKGRHCNVLQHMAGHLKTLIGGEERAGLSGLIGDYRRGMVPLIVPITLIRHFVNRYKVEYLLGQSYLQPHPKELMLRNHV